jgi:hypothetical protein
MSVKVLKYVLLILGILTCVTIIVYVINLGIGMNEKSAAIATVSNIEHENPEPSESINKFEISRIEKEIAGLENQAKQLQNTIDTLPIEIQTQKDLLGKLKKIADKADSIHPSDLASFNNLSMFELQQYKKDLVDETHIRNTMKTEKMTRRKVEDWFWDLNANIDYIICKKEAEEKEKSLALTKTKHQNILDEIEALMDKLQELED